MCYWAGIAVLLLAKMAVKGAPVDPCVANLPEFAPPPLTFGPADLQRVVVTSRHGDRIIYDFTTPLDHEIVWPDDLCNVSDVVSLGSTDMVHSMLVRQDAPWMQGVYFAGGNCVIGQLTRTGVEQCLNVGRRLREIYIDKYGLLPDTLAQPSDLDLLRIRTTDTWRTRQSIESILNGMYPPSKRAGDLRSGTTPIPIVWTDFQLDPLTLQDHPCPRLDQIIEQRGQDPDFQNETEQIREFLRGVGRKLDLTDEFLFKRPDIPGWIRDDLTPRVCHAIPLPCSSVTGQCVTMEEFRKLTQIDMFTQMRLFDSPEAQVLVAGFQMAEYMKAITGELDPTAKYFHFSTHDDNIWGLLVALNIADETLDYWPPYASTFIFEVWKSAQLGGETYVRVFFNGQVRTIPECHSEPCTLTELQNIVQSRLSVYDVAEQCALH